MQLCSFWLVKYWSGMCYKAFYVCVSHFDILLWPIHWAFQKCKGKDYAVKYFKYTVVLKMYMKTINSAIIWFCHCVRIFSQVEVTFHYNKNNLSIGQNSINAHFIFKPFETAHTDRIKRLSCHCFEKDPPFLCILLNSLFKLLNTQNLSPSGSCFWALTPHDQSVCSSNTTLSVSRLLLWISRKTCWDLFANSFASGIAVLYKGTCCAPGYVYCLCCSFFISAILYSNSSG